MKIKKNLIIACTGSVATIKLPLLIEKLGNAHADYSFNVSSFHFVIRIQISPETLLFFQIKVIVTEHAKHFVNYSTIPQNIDILDDENEWKAWNKRGDPVLHIDLGKWADMLVIAPLSANSLAKMAMVSEIK